MKYLIHTSIQLIVKTDYCRLSKIWGVSFYREMISNDHIENNMNNFFFTIVGNF